jgi:glycosyltransferase involved in cell wall biosynthesis
MFFVDRILQSFSTKIIAVSAAVKQSLLRHGINPERILVLYNATDISRYGSVSDEKLRKELNPQNQFTYIFIGRLIDQKGIDVLLEAFAKLSSGLLFLVGDGIDKEKFVELTHVLGVHDRVRFLGIRKDIQDLLKFADCFVLPSRYEGLGVVLLEAIVSGKAIIISDFEAGKELIKNEYNGLIVPRENSQALTNAMRRIQDDTDLRKRLETNAKRDSEKFSITHHVDALLNIITA